MISGKKSSKILAFLSGVLILICSLNLASASDGNLTLTTKKTSQNGNNPVWFKFETAPGTEIKDSVIVKNYSQETKKIKLYAADAYSNENGSFTLNEEGGENKNIGAWTELAFSSLEVKGGEEAEVPFTIYVPKQVSPGTYSGGVLVEEDNDFSSLPCIENNPASCNANIKINTRIASRIYINVAGELNPSIKWTDFSVRQNRQNELTFKFKFENQGNVSFEPRAIIEIFDMMGNRIEKIERRLGESMPGSITEPQTNFKPEKGVGLVNIKAQVYFEPKYFSNNLLKNAPESTFRYARMILLPWQVSLLLLISISGGILYFYYSKWAEQMLLKRCHPYIVKTDDNLEALANDTDSNWKLLAKINHIKAPYTINKGQKIKLPYHDNANEK